MGFFIFRRIVPVAFTGAAVMQATPILNGNLSSSNKQEFRKVDFCLLLIITPQLAC